MKLPIKVFSSELAKNLLNKKINPELQLTEYEEYTTLWLWAYPELLGWHHDIKWLFSPVTGNSRYPGDLWGIDSQGNLIIVETKSVKHKRLQDPFVDFIGLESRCKVSNKNVFEPKSLQKRWEKLFERELKFLEIFQNDFRKGVIEKQTSPGIVPYSSKRSVVVRWPYLYLNVITQQFHEKSNYKKLVHEYLKKRSANIFATQHFFGVIGTSPNIHPGLSNQGKVNYDKLCTEIGKDRIHLIEIKASLLKTGTVQLESTETKLG